MKVPIPDLSRYREVVRDLPRPSPLQIHEFVRFVRQAGSWYKHLLPGWAFQFYLDPCAGYEIQVSRDGTVQTLERVQRPLSAPRNWMKTKEYRQRFGYLSYDCDAVCIGLSGSKVGGNRAERTALAFTRDGQAVAVPPELGYVEVTGVIHRCSSQPYAWSDYVDSYLWPEEMGDAATVQRIREICHAWVAGHNRKSHFVWIAPLVGIDMEIEALIIPERKRLHRKMCEAVTRMLQTIDS